MTELERLRLQLIAENEQDRANCAEWWSKATSAHKVAVWNVMQRPSL